MSDGPEFLGLPDRPLREADLEELRARESIDGLAAITRTSAGQVVGFITKQPTGWAAYLYGPSGEAPEDQGWQQVWACPEGKVPEAAAVAANAALRAEYQLAE